MSRKKWIICLFISIIIGLNISLPASTCSQDKDRIFYEPKWESLMQHEATPQWYEDAVLGFYYHWGPYAVPAFACWGYWTMYNKGSDEHP